VELYHSSQGIKNKRTCTSNTVCGMHVKRQVRKKIDWNPQHPIEWAGTTIETHTLSETNESSNEFTIDQEKESILSFETQ
jgi:hypothetical protein